MFKNLIKFTLFFLLAIALITYSLIGIPIKASNENYVQIFVNGKNIDFPDQKPYIDTKSNRTLVPVRFIAEAINNSSVEWLQETKTVKITAADSNIKLSIGSANAYVNGITTQIDAIPKLINDRTMVPLRFIAESLGTTVQWDEKNRAVNLETKEFYKVNNNKSKKQTTINATELSMGDSKEKLLEILGQPARIDLSEYGFYWYIYNQDYYNYIQVGIKDGKIVALFTNSRNWSLLDNISINSTQANIRANYGEPLQYILKNRTRYSLLNEQNTRDVYQINDNYISFFYDVHSNHEVSSILIIDKNIEESFRQDIQPNSELRVSFEKQMLDITNATRVKHGKSPFKWCNNAAHVARMHSSDMMNRGYFSHDTPKGKTLANRFNDYGIRYKMVGENIAAGQQSAIHAHESLMNSLGHRKNILGDFKYLGVGTAFGGSYNTYYTQNFYTSR
ncbi:hypothetical protein SYNTR_1489 [Candidatus Syntrophocurvum alkaliphilum]|uniref:Copper amine oxidase-like N-terminal domain-containing protein n=1 Tax=Candidatus Syntrophocurvum alkaliphilum TaxID=2293317 RepID=A0A6I6DGV0_9FIRM|nr:CAP-associated domain-containing protein [Candidatus Syntrophocurvum alkaliphilum]QGU00083.1 hypothetical protein SYNTR_1489 [Candidatus Syntrophocurvum alkaliphilum]